MKISVLIPYRSNGDDYRDRNFGIVWTQWMQFLGESAEIVIGENTDEIYNRSSARNDAFKRCKGDIIILADADTLFVHTAVSRALSLIYKGTAQWVLPYLAYYNATESWSNAYCERPTLLDKPPPVYEHVLMGSTAGVLITTREAFLRVRGYDERFIGWGWEDLAFSCALSSLFHKPERVGGFVVHLFHHRSMQENFGQPMEPHNRELYERYYASEHDIEAMEALIKEHSCVSM